jgi:hypothetical protein
MILWPHASTGSTGRSRVRPARRSRRAELGGMLLEKKTALRHGEWLPWRRAYFEGSERQAQRFMQLYSERDKLLQNPTRVSDLGFREALRAISPPPKEDQKEDSTKTADLHSLVAKVLARKAMDRNPTLAKDSAGAAAPDDAPAEPREPVASETKVWSDEERELLARLQSGETVVVNMHHDAHPNLVEWAKDAGVFVRIDRRTVWGNPFETPDDGDREAVVYNFEHHYLPYKPSLEERRSELRGGKALACWCSPALCHGDVLKTWAEAG